jgi:class 3 adenylate cyclase
MIEHRTIKVLIVEDDEFITMVYLDQLKDVSNITFEIDTVSIFKDGIEAIENKTYDVLLLDLNLPDSNYSQTIEKIPSLSAKLPVVIMTSTNDEVLALKTMNMGSQDYLIKTKLERTLFIRSVLYAIERNQLRLQLQDAKDKSDALLRNILPESIAEELKNNGKVTAKYFENVSVMFIDFTNFTELSSSMNPNELVEELNICFSFFDEITKELCLEKIKTIGDAYMCAGGIPDENSHHVKNIIKAALRINSFMEERYNEKKILNKKYWNCRIGIHVGPVVAGVVGSRKFTYDIWGDTVNTASRMETASQMGKINISGPVFEQVKNEFNCTHRGKISAKGKGEIDMYFVESVK